MLSNDPEVESTESGSMDPVPEALSEVVTDGPKIRSSSETLSSLSRQSIHTIYLAGVSMVIMAAASAIFYMKKKIKKIKKSKATKPANVRVTDDDMCSESCSAESSSVQKGFKKKSSYNKRESLASSSTDLSMGSPFYGSFTTYERIPIKYGEEVLMTPIRSIKALLFMDVCMPVMDGLEATRLIRSYEKTGNWDEATKAGVEPCDSPSYDQILEEPRRRIPIIAVSAMKLNILTIVNCLACCRICITRDQHSHSFLKLPWGEERSLTMTEIDAVVNAWFSLWRDG